MQCIRKSGKYRECILILVQQTHQINEKERYTATNQQKGSNNDTRKASSNVQVTKKGRNKVAMQKIYIHTESY